MKIKFGSYDYLPLNKTIEIPSLIIVAAGIFQENNKYYRRSSQMNPYVNCLNTVLMVEATRMSP